MTENQPRRRVPRETTELPGATRLSLDATSGEGPPSTTCNAGVKKDVDGRPAPAMTKLNGLPTLKRLLAYGS